ncbi:putative calcium-binding protein CML14 [Platanthera guangdongensis]|uniref:Calcium-binding protein CML14 n=1 Tax=Platanthera guangdongensis TaxID=2320717 RepID=A0ABR2LL68_9ASPA
MDANGNGTGEFEELAGGDRASDEREALVNQEQLLDGVQVLRSCGNGYISAAELARPWRGWAKPNFCELNAMMREADTTAMGLSASASSPRHGQIRTEFLGLAVAFLGLDRPSSFSFRLTLAMSFHLFV